jgi:signal peptidase I
MSKQKHEKAHAKRKDRAAEIANTFEWLITAFMLAFVFRAFVMEAFQIPTGSMAHTLMGAHYRMVCKQCGYPYEYGFSAEKYGLPQGAIAVGKLRSEATRCPNCGHDILTEGRVPISGGDRILVLKCIYQFFEPKQWDVVVFKDPLDPNINYIKRMIGKPGQTVEIIDGDVYIDGRISRKPEKVQNDLWMPLFNNDYQPVRPDNVLFEGNYGWDPPFKTNESQWKVPEDNPTIFRLSSSPNHINKLSYNTSVMSFRASYAYNDVRSYGSMPLCSDIKTRFYIKPESDQGVIGVSMSKYETIYKAWVDLFGEMIISKKVADTETVLASLKIERPVSDQSVCFSFENVDHNLVFSFGNDVLTVDLGTGPDDLGKRKSYLKPEVQIFGAGDLTLSHIALFRDIHYTDMGDRAIEGKPLQLNQDEFFVLGDNSPNSADGRVWASRGLSNDGTGYRAGIVPRDYLVGKAMFVYLPSFFKPFGKDVRVGMFNFGDMRFIHGG